MGRKNPQSKRRRHGKKIKLATSIDGTSWRLALRESPSGHRRWCMVGPHDPLGAHLMVARRIEWGWKVDDLPPGAIRGNMKRQRYHWEGGHPAYLDYPFTCHNCGRGDVFTAAAQKHWYETLGGYGDSGPVHCIDCRRASRHKKRAHRLLAEALAAYDADPSPQSSLAVAEATAEAGDGVGPRARQRGLGHARKALKAGLKAAELVGLLTASVE